MAIPLHVFMRELMSDHHVGERCPKIKLIFDNAANPQSNFGVMTYKAASCAMSEPSESSIPRTYHRLSRISRSDTQTYCLDISDHSKGISRWGGIRPIDGNTSRFDSCISVTNNPSQPPVAPPRMMSPSATGTGNKGLLKAIDPCPSKEALLRTYGDKNYAKCNGRSIRRTGLTNAVERALDICDSRTDLGSS
ncbi:hypothetical protein IV203_020734 [Nitzschia inconspicua]|uniref:Uncharacterized protein n=1 Tax=Nitzschia inconspicua TaxID=303405 RepID=A0A9K3PDB8_9STRA|nr:hypothetical protein IV203_021574 [Nitzschia inconspicua]KAG7342790.1 hypothetical protein IV203_020734 [Nitzschia inconspicua]